MIIVESGKYLFITIEPDDWQRYGKSLLETIKSIPGRMYYPADKSWKIPASEKHHLSSFLPPFTLQEEAEGEIGLRQFLSQFEDNTSYSL